MVNRIKAEIVEAIRRAAGEDEEAMEAEEECPCETIMKDFTFRCALKKLEEVVAKGGSHLPFWALRSLFEHFNKGKTDDEQATF